MLTFLPPSFELHLQIPLAVIGCFVFDMSANGFFCGFPMWAGRTGILVVSGI